MFFTRMLAAVDRVVSKVLSLSSSSSSPGPDGAARESCYFGYFGPRYVIFRNGKVYAIGGIFEVQHRYDDACRLLSRRLRRKAEFKEGDAILYGYRLTILGLKGERHSVGMMA